ncbi:DUF2949 domain-containing protein [Chroococcidiopsis sp. SAG 2025]|uniref:DUF2949 domain-containing protein n=1 Tax=Chroococcidiopsis sp. SAG 2025 TaxID=171389 RepID=UPI003977B791
MKQEMNASHQEQLLDFLQEKLAIPPKAIAMALRLNEQNPGPLPMLMWQYGLISLEQLEQIFDWMAS